MAIFEFSGPRGQNWGPETRIFILICNKNPKINVFLKFEGPTSKIENFKILTIFENFLKNFGALNQNSVPNSFLAILRSTYSENFKPLAQKLREEF